MTKIQMINKIREIDRNISKFNVFNPRHSSEVDKLIKEKMEIKNSLIRRYGKDFKSSSNNIVSMKFIPDVIV